MIESGGRTELDVELKPTPGEIHRFVGMSVLKRAMYSQRLWFADAGKMKSALRAVPPLVGGYVWSVEAVTMPKLKPAPRTPQKRSGF